MAKTKPRPTAPPDDIRGALRILQPRLTSVVAVRMSSEQRQRLHAAALIVTKERGNPIDDSTLARELIMRGVSRYLDA